MLFVARVDKFTATTTVLLLLVLDDTLTLLLMEFLGAGGVRGAFLDAQVLTVDLTRLLI